MPINFFVDIPSFHLNHQAELKAWIKTVIRQEGKECGEINYNLLNDAEIQALNVNYLHHDYPTDIITFPYSHTKEVSGDIAISIDTVKRNSQDFHTDFIDEMHRVMIHGVLHLLGYDDRSPEEKKIMHQKENDALSLLSV